MTENYLEYTDKYIKRFRKKKQRNTRKVWGILITLMIITALLAFFLIDYIFPIPIDTIGFRINYYLIVIGLLYQLIISLSSNDRHLHIFIAIAPPSRRQPLFGKNLRRIKEHHPRQLLPRISPLFLTHLIIWFISFLGSALVAILIPGEVRKWKKYIINYGGFSLAIGSFMYLVFTVVTVKWNYTLLTINIVNSLFIGLSIPGMASIFYTTGSVVSSNLDTPAKTILGGVLIIILCITIALLIPYPLIERIFFSLLFKLAAGFWLILIFIDIMDFYHMHKV